MNQHGVIASDLENTTNHYVWIRRWANFPVAGILCLAGLLKSLSISPVTLSNGFMKFGEGLTFLLGIAELVLAVWLVSGWKAGVVRRVGIGTFLAFGIVAIWKSAMGAADCGCFGDVRMHPMLSLGIDAACLAMLVHWRPLQSCNDKPATDELTVTLVCSMAIVVATAWTALVSRVGDRGVQATGISADTAILDPTAWVGQELPIATSIYDGHLLLKGKWTVLFYRDSCGKCHSLIEQLHEWRFASLPVAKIALIKIPPSDLRFAIRPFGDWLWTSLDSEHDWLIETPCVLTVADGQVEACRQTW